MRIPSNYLAAIAAGKNGDIALEDGVLNVPPIVVPSFDIPRPARTVATFDCSAVDGPVINDSQVQTLYCYHQNQAAQDDTAFYLLSGLWRLTGRLYVQYEFVAAPPVLNMIANVDFMDQAGTRANFMTAFGNATVRGLYEQAFDFTVNVKPRPDLSVVQGDVWTCFFQVAATNAAAANQLQVQFSCDFQRYI